MADYLMHKMEDGAERPKERQSIFEKTWAGFENHCVICTVRLETTITFHKTEMTNDQADKKSK